MSEPIAIEDQNGAETTAAYASSVDHLLDELRRLELLISCRLPERGAETPVNPLEPFKGLVVAEEEIRELLGNAFNPSFYDGDQVPDGVPNQQLAALRQMGSEIQMRRVASLDAGVYLSMAALAQIFDLNSFEEQCVLICLAPELDRKFDKLYAYLQDDVTRKKPTVGLVLDLLCRTMREKLAARMAVHPESPLLKYRLLQVTDDSLDGSSTLISRSLKLDDRIVNFLLGFEQIDSRLQSIARLVSPRAELEQVPVGEQIRTKIRRFIDWHCNRKAPGDCGVVFHFCGNSGSERQLLTEAICRELKLSVIIAKAPNMIGGHLPLQDGLWLLGREAALQSAALCLQDFDCLLANDNHSFQLESLLAMAKTFDIPVFLLSSRPWKPLGLLQDSAFFDLELRIPDDGTRKRLWESHLNGESPFATDDEAGALASKFQFTPGQIRDAVISARNLARWRAPADGQLTAEDLRAACRAQADAKLHRLARKVRAIHTWNDIVLPADALAQLHEMCRRVDQSFRVLGEWGFGAKLSTGKGVNALFSGPSGTGKTMAAGIIANELGLELYKIDLSQVVSKYIGETEKNLDSVFSAAENCNSILFFDEADSLFGKRSEVRDSHDRYANIEVSYLLQKMEDYQGVAILATNLRQNLDEAFVRRLAFSIHFPFPGESERNRIWSDIWPDQVSLADDVDFNLLARKFPLNGGNIKNIALAAAFSGAADGGIVKMSHLLRATRREYQKLGKAMTEFEIADIAHEPPQSEASHPNKVPEKHRK